MTHDQKTGGKGGDSLMQDGTLRITNGGRCLTIRTEGGKSLSIRREEGMR